MNSLFYTQIEPTDANRQIIEEFETLVNSQKTLQLYLVTAPLGEKYSYDYEPHAIVVLSTKHKIIFLDLKGDVNAFDEYCDDFIEDLSALSDKYKYKEHIGRPRDWKKEVIAKIKYDQKVSVEELLRDNELNKPLQRKAELLISLLIGSINDIERVGVQIPESLLDRVKKNIILFDGDQTRFIYKKFPNKSISIQGLSGTGKTELLLHKLKDLYVIEDNSKIFFTCHNIALANTLKQRIPSFFNFLKVEKQIEWNSRLWIDRAWGSQKDKNSGFYSYLCDYYGIPFIGFSRGVTYQVIFQQVLEHLQKISDEDFSYAFDYILIDERQDFPKVFFEVCKRVARKKVYIAGDIFQDIFENTKEIELEVDIILNRCYRTDPRTLMFAHAVGMRLFEEKKLNWFEDIYWNAIGYSITHVPNSREVLLKRDPIRRFEDLELEQLQSVIIQPSTQISNVLGILKSIQDKNQTVQAGDIAIIVLDDNNSIYGYIDKLALEIKKHFGWEVNRAYESKAKIENSVYISNPNNVKGLEFPFVLCLTGAILDSYRYRNILYTMLTRSFIQSYLLVQNDTKIQLFRAGLEEINKNRSIKTIEPTEAEKLDIKNTLLKIQEEKTVSYKEFLEDILLRLNIPKKCWKRFEQALLQAEFEKFDKIKTEKFIKANKEFYCE